MYAGKNKHPGQAMVGVLIIFLLVAALAIASVTLAASHRQNTARQKDTVQAYYAAEAGVERTLLRIKTDPGWFMDWLNQININTEKDFITYITPDYMPPLSAPLEKIKIKKIAGFPTAQIEINSTGKSRPGEGAARKTLLINARLYHPAGLLNGCSILSESRLDVTLGASFSLTGSNGQKPVFYVNGNLTRKGQGHSDEINADIYAAGSITGNFGSSTLHPNYHNIPSFPVLDENWYRTNAQKIFNGDTVFGNPSRQNGQGNNSQHGHGNSSGNNPHQEPDATPPYNGIYYVNGDAHISGTYTGKAVIFVTGDVTITDDLEAQDNNSILVIIALNNPVEIKNYNVDAFIIAKKGIDYNGNATINGGLLAGSFEEKVNGNLTINCLPALINNNFDFFLRTAFNPDLLEIKIDSWREQYDIF